jgi:hypothetical protein
MAKSAWRNWQRVEVKKCGLKATMPWAWRIYRVCLR